jgi:hypothetical protein
MWYPKIILTRIKKWNMDINIKDLESQYSTISYESIIKVDRYFIEAHSPRDVQEYKIYLLMNTYNILQSYYKETLYYSLKYDLGIHRDDNTEAVADIIKAYSGIGFNISACHLNKESLDIILTLPNNDLELFKSGLLTYNYNQLIQLNTNIRIDKIETLYLKKIQEQDDYC